MKRVVVMLTALFSIGLWTETAEAQFVITQITVSSGVGSSDASINSDGTRIAFHSSGDYTGDNADGNTEIFLFDTNTMSFTQITDSMGDDGSILPSINSDGTRIAFESNRDLTGNNPDLDKEIFLYDTNTMSFTQITNTTGGGSNNDRPSINSDGTRIAFESDRDLTGENPDLNRETFLAVGGDACVGLSPTAGCVVNGTPFQPCLGTDGSDVIIGANQDDIIRGLGGNDIITGLNGGDTICGGEGNDTINGLNGVDELFGDSGNDTLIGHNGADALDGGAGTDFCGGGQGMDSGVDCEVVVSVP